MRPASRVSLLMLFVAFWVISAQLSAASSARADWTVMVFMNGSDLESEAMAGTADLLEMMRVGSTDRVHLVVETLGTAQWHMEGIDAGKNQRFYIRRGRAELREELRDDEELREAFAGLVQGNPAGAGLVLLEDDLGLRRLADPVTLADFLVWSMLNFPARRYALILWNHGAGSVVGFGADEHFDGESLSLKGLFAALQAAYQVTGTQLELIGFDACLMGAVEVAYVASPFARYMVASQEVEPGNGWDYASALAALVADSSMDGARLGRILVDTYVRHSAERSEDFADIVTLSVTDLSKVGALTEALDRFVQVAAVDVVDPQALRQFARARRNSESYGNSSDSSFDMVDLGDLVGKVTGLYPGESQAVRSALSETVVYSVSGRGKPNASGLSVWLPFRDKAQIAANLAAYHDQTPFTPAYHEFVDTYARYLFAPRSPIRLVSVQPEMQIDDEGDEYYVVTVVKEDRDRVFAVDSVLAYSDPEHEDQAILLGIVREAVYDEETGEIVQYLPNELPTLDGYLISFFEQNASETAVEWTVPVLLNGRQVDLVVLWDPDTWEGKVIGAWPGTVEGSAVAAKDLIPIRRGDRISPLFHWLGPESVEETYVYWDEFVVEDELRLGWEPAPEGEYRFAFVITDVNQLETYSDFIAIQYVADEGSSPEAAGYGR